jgi:hypothetical protein
VVGKTDKKKMDWELGIFGLAGLLSKLERLESSIKSERWRGGALHALSGATKAAILYIVPLLILKRKKLTLSQWRHAVAVAAFVASIRSVDYALRPDSTTVLPGSTRGEQNEREQEQEVNNDTADDNGGANDNVKANNANTSSKTVNRQNDENVVVDDDDDVDDHESKDPLRRWRFAIAGALGAVVLSSLDNEFVSSLLLSWTVVRALRCLVPAVNYGPTAFMCLSAGQILSSWIAAPNAVDPSYFRFLTIHGGQSKQTMATLLALPRDLCVTHPGLGCHEHLAVFWPEGFGRALKVYSPLYLAFFLFSRQKLAALPRLAGNVARSSAFLATYCTLAWYSGCLFYRVSPQVSRAKLFVHCMLAGLATLIERPGRRTELASYCCTYALHSIYLQLRKRNLVRPSQSLGTLTFAISLAIILHNHSALPSFLTSWLFALTRQIVRPS